MKSIVYTLCASTLVHMLLDVLYQCSQMAVYIFFYPPLTAIINHMRYTSVRIRQYTVLLLDILAARSHQPGRFRAEH